MLIQFQQTTTPQRLQLLVEHCIYGVVFFLPLSLSASTVFLTIGLLLWVAVMGLERRLSFGRTPFDKAILLFVMLSALSILASPDRGFSLYNYYHLMGRYIAIYYLVIYNITTLEQVKRLVSFLLVSAFFVTAYGFVQYFHGVDISAFEWVDGEQFPDLKIRVFSTLHNPNLLAGFLVMMLAVASGIALYSHNVRLKCLLAVFAVMLGYCLVLTYSRGAWISALAVLAVYGMLYNKKVLWALLAVPLLIMFSYEGVVDRLLSIVNPTDTSSALRWALWESTLFMILYNPIVGIGWGSYWIVYPEYDFFIQNAAVTIFHAHNTYLHMAAEIGIPGFLVFLYIGYSHVKLALQGVAAHETRWLQGLMLGIVAAFAGIAVNGLTDHVLYNIQLAMLMWLLSALIIVVWNKENISPEKTL